MGVQSRVRLRCTYLYLPCVHRQYILVYINREREYIYIYILESSRFTRNRLQVIIMCSNSEDTVPVGANKDIRRIPTYEKPVSRDNLHTSSLTPCSPVGCAIKSEGDDCEMFTCSKIEVEPYQTSLNMQATADLCDDHSSDVVSWGEQNSSDSGSMSDDDDDHQQFMDTESSTVLPNIPSPFIYNDCPFPHQENDIYITLEADKDMLHHGVSVLVEPNCLSSFPSSSDGNVYPFSIQEVGTPSSCKRKALQCTIK